MNQITVTYTPENGPRKVVVMDGDKHDVFDVLERCRRRIFPGVAVPDEGERIEKVTTQEGGHVSASLSASHNSGEVAVNHASGPHVSGVRDTSRDAYAKYGATGKLSRQQEIIVAVLRGSRRDYTRQELAKKTGLGINAVCGRVNELMQEPFCALVEHRRRKCDVTGENVMALSLREGA